MFPIHSPNCRLWPLTSTFHADFLSRMDPRNPPQSLSAPLLATGHRLGLDSSHSASLWFNLIVPRFFAERNEEWVRLKIGEPPRILLHQPSWDPLQKDTPACAVGPAESRNKRKVWPASHSEVGHPGSNPRELASSLVSAMPVEFKCQKQRFVTFQRFAIPEMAFR